VCDDRGDDFNFQFLFSFRLDNQPSDVRSETQTALGIDDNFDMRDARILPGMAFAIERLNFPPSRRIKFQPFGIGGNFPRDGMLPTFMVQLKKVVRAVGLDDANVNRT